MQIDALADNGHSRVENVPGAAPMELPVRVVAFSDGLYVIRATDSNADLLGGRVTAVDGQSIDAVMSKLEQLRGGTANWRRLHASQYLTQQDLLFGIDVGAGMQHSDWSVETPTGATITRRLEAFPTPRRADGTGGTLVVERALGGHAGNMARTRTRPPAANFMD